MQHINEISAKHLRIAKLKLDIANIKIMTYMIKGSCISKWRLYENGCVKNDVPDLGYLKFNFQLGSH